MIQVLGWGLAPWPLQHYGAYCPHIHLCENSRIRQMFFLSLSVYCETSKEYICTIDIDKLITDIELIGNARGLPVDSRL